MCKDVISFSHNILKGRDYMPRGVRKTVDYSDSIAKIDEKIAAHKDSIKELTKQKNEILNKKKSADMEAALKIIEDKGISAGELLEMLKVSPK